jgi:hypothetical protein
MPFNFDPHQGSIPKLDAVYNKISKGKKKEDILTRNPAYIGNGDSSGNSEIDELAAEGWKPLGTGQATTGYAGGMLF